MERVIPVRDIEEFIKRAREIKEEHKKTRQFKVELMAYFEGQDTILDGLENWINQPGKVREIDG